MGFSGSALGSAAGALISPLGSLLFGSKPKAAAPASPLPVPTRDIAAEIARRSDIMRRRKGSRGNQYAGDAGAVTPGTKVLLGPAGP